MLGTTLRTMSLLVLAVAAAEAQNAAATRDNWPHYGGTQFAWRYSPLDQINAAKVKALTPAWIFQTGDYAEGLLSTPLVIDGVMYVITVIRKKFVRCEIASR